MGELHCSKEKKRKVAHVTVFLLPNPVIPSQFIIQFMSHILLLEVRDFSNSLFVSSLSLLISIQNCLR